jgi:hypothetical protein
VQRYDRRRLAVQGDDAMMYEDVVRDFAECTRANLRAIDQLYAEGKKVYEITQLVNSTLGLLVFPQQEYVDQIPHTPLEELEQNGWPIPRVTGGFQQVSDLNQLVRYLRHAIAHFNIEFIGDGQGKIGGLRVWNNDPGNGKRIWEAELSVDDFRKFLNRFADLLQEKSLAA